MNSKKRRTLPKDEDEIDDEAIEGKLLIAATDLMMEENLNELVALRLRQLQILTDWALMADFDHYDTVSYAQDIYNQARTHWENFIAAYRLSRSFPKQRNHWNFIHQKFSELYDIVCSYQQLIIGITSAWHIRIDRRDETLPPPLNVESDVGRHPVVYISTTVSSSGASRDAPSRIRPSGIANLLASPDCR